MGHTHPTDKWSGISKDEKEKNIVMQCNKWTHQKTDLLIDPPHCFLNYFHVRRYVCNLTHADWHFALMFLIVSARNPPDSPDLFRTLDIIFAIVWLEMPLSYMRRMKLNYFSLKSVWFNKSVSGCSSEWKRCSNWLLDDRYQQQSNLEHFIWYSWDISHQHPATVHQRFFLLMASWNYLSYNKYSFPFDQPHVFGVAWFVLV